MTDDVLKSLAQTIRDRRASTGDVSYTRKLIDGGAETCAKKLAEEAAEAVIAAVSQDDSRLTSEAADVLYHLLVLLEVRDVPFDDVLDELRSRMGTSGLEEKAARTRSG